MKRIFGLLKTSTLKDTLISFTGLGVTAILGFVFTIIMARVLGPVQYGVFSAVTALTSIVYNLGDLGVSSALINFLPKLREKRQVLIDSSFWFQILIAIFILVLFLILSFFNNRIIPNSIPLYLILAGILSASYLLVGFAQGVFTAERRFWTFSISQIVDSGIKIILIFFFVSQTNLTITNALIANIISSLIAFSLTFFKDLRSVEAKFDTGIFRKLFSFAKWIAISRVFSVMFSKIDIILLNLLATSFDAGIFAAASRVTLLFALLVSSLNSVINPRFSGFDKKEKVISYIKKLSLFISGIALLMLICVFLAGPIITLVFGDKYLPAIPVFRWMTISMLPFLFSLITTPAILYTYNKPDFFAKTTAFQVITIIIMEIILIPRISYYAPVVAMGVTNVFVLIITAGKLRQLINSDEI